MRTKLLILGFALTTAIALATGCANGKKEPTIKQKAEAQWAGARSSVLASLAQDQYKSGSFDKCRKTVDDALALTPESAPLRILSAKLAIEQGQLERADQELAVAR